VKQVWKFRSQFGSHSRADVDRRRECPLEFHVVGNAGVDQDAVVEVAGQIKRIALRSPGFLHEIDIGLRIEAGTHRPQHLIEIAGIDVLIDDHRPFTGISATLAGARHV